MTHTTSAAEEYAALLNRVRRDRRVLGLVLSGSRARAGVATERSDYDVYLVVEDGAGPLTALARRDALLDVMVLPLAEFRTHALAGSGTEWNRYAFTHAKVEMDTADGLIGELVAAKGALTREEAAALAPGFLDAFLNSAYRCVKSARDGQVLAAGLDAAEAVPYFLTYVFALHNRVRPYNKYLPWELRHHPLSRPEWSHDHLVPLLSEVLTPSAPTAIRRLFTELEPQARGWGHGPVLDDWGDDLGMLRVSTGVPRQPTGSRG
ncbi:hypothetical protein ACH41E_02260 [Streptomyces sp. NPDC020412]|uniref:hypothetical protein n=1 Tax=Streptomyces sp. NPDC020412 TaxID=3365073 RepID=UPI00378C1724